MLLRLHVIFQDREDDIPVKKQNIEAINRSGAILDKQESLTSEDKQNIQADLDNLNTEWAKVAFEIVTMEIMDIT